jgi:hypothetical protein
VVRRQRDWDRGAVTFGQQSVLHLAEHVKFVIIDARKLPIDHNAPQGIALPDGASLGPGENR